LWNSSIGLSSLGLVVIGGIGGLSLPALIDLVTKCATEETQVTIKMMLALLWSQLTIFVNLICEVGLFVGFGGGHGGRGG
jgi:hypothetical protein